MLSWKRIKEISKIEIDLDFSHPVLNPIPHVLDMLLRVHRRVSQGEEPFILLVAEKDTLDTVTENNNLVQYLNRIDGVKAALTSPDELEQRGDEVTLGGRKATVIFVDFNNDVLLTIGEKYDIEPLLTGIRQGIVVNPRGMEPLGAKGVFEAVTDDSIQALTRSTVGRTPWTRLFYPRKTTGPHGERIEDLMAWAREHWSEIILKPVHGYSGRGIVVGFQSDTPDQAIQTALEEEPYIIQALVPTTLWAEEFPWLDTQAYRITLKQWQTDFRCLIDDVGLIGLLARFGGIPTNVGAGGGNQSVAILKTPISVRDAVDRINEAIMGLGFSTAMEIEEEVDILGMELGHTYLKGPTPTTLRPRIIAPDHLTSLQEYSANLRGDLLILEKMWREGALNHVVQMEERETRIAQMQPWDGSPALIASDGLFSFGAHPQDAEVLLRSEGERKGITK
jgi:hypothetical protein